jgi:hypothetical protein
MYYGAASLNGWKRDGTAWYLRMGNIEGAVEEVRLAGPLDHTRWSSLTLYCGNGVGVRADGTLWVWKLAVPGGSTAAIEVTQVGKETDWSAVAAETDSLVALKTDGSLWRWKTDWKQGCPEHVYDPDLSPRAISALKKAATRIGSDSDWLAIARVQDAVVGLTADGNLWALGRYRQFVAPSWKPALVENILASAR